MIMGQVQTQGEMQRRAQLGVICLGLVLLTAALYWPVRNHDFINYDDDLYVTQNAMVQKGLTLEGVGWAFTTDHAYNWHPLTWLSHMLDCRLFGLDAGAHHLMSVAGHAANAVLLFLLLFRLTGAVWRSAAVAALFAVHPLRVESVAWIAERKDVLCLFCWLLTIHAYVHYVKQPDRRRYLLLLLAGAVAMLSKPMIVTLPFTLLLLDVWPLGRLPVETGNRRDGETAKAPLPRFPVAPLLGLVREKIPLFIFAAGLSAITFWIQKETGAVSVGQHYTFGNRCANAVVSYLRYLGKFVWPADLALPYPHPGSWPVTTALAGAVLLFALSVIFMHAAGRRPWLLVGWLWYLGTLVPVIGLIQVGGQAMADRYTYVPMIGIAVMLVWGAADLLEAVSLRRFILWAAGILAIAGCVVATSLQLRHWRNSETLFRHIIEVTPNNAIAQFNLGHTLAAQKKLAEAIEHYAIGLSLSPNDAKGHLNLGRALEEHGAPDQAVRHYKQALQLRPDWVDAHSAMGLILALRRDLDGAVAHFSAILALDPGNSRAHNNLGNTLYLQGKFDAAIPHFARAIQLAPENTDAIVNLGLALDAAGKRGEALMAFTRAAQLKPDHAPIHYQLAVMLTDAGKLPEALPHYREAVRLKPDWPELLSHLAWLLATHPDRQVRNGAEAVKLAERACELTGRQSAGPLDGLAAAYAEAGRFADAVSTAQQALALAQTAQKELAGQIQSRLQLYQAGKPYRAP